MKVLLLEDDPFRMQAFQEVLVAADIDHTMCADPIDFILELVTNAEDIQAISLDHDLSRIERPCGSLTFECGCAVVAVMKRIKPFCPVILHSQNEFAAATMTTALREAAWNVAVVTDPPEL